jgi:hypothetical protein
MGSGSDFTGFIQHIGVPSLAMSLSGTLQAYGAVYHSNYDSIYWYFAESVSSYIEKMGKLIPGIPVVENMQVPTLGRPYYGLPREHGPHLWRHWCETSRTLLQP